jgi:hypothetical protein
LRAEGFATSDDGLATPALTAAIGRASGEQGERIRIRVGSSTREITPISERDEEDAEPVTVRAVAVDDDPTVYLVPDSDIEDLFVDAFDLRAKTLVQFTQDDLDALAFTVGDETWELDRDGEAWRVTSPVPLRLEGEEVGDVLWDLNYLRMDAVAAEWAADAAPPLDRWGLSSPRYRIVARAGDVVLADVAIGDDVPAAEIGDEESAGAGGRVFVLVDGWSGVYQVGDGIADAAAELVGVLDDGDR